LKQLYDLAAVGWVFVKLLLFFIAVYAVAWVARQGWERGGQDFDKWNAIEKWWAKK
jgi:hypothetical protein